MNNLLSTPDQSDPLVKAAIRKNERVAMEAVRLIARRNRKLPPEKVFEMVSNTIGIMCAELVRDAHGIAGEEFSVAMRDLVIFHMDKSIELLREDSKGAVH